MAFNADAVAEDGNTQRWEEGLEATWESVQESADGTLSLEDQEEKRRKRRRHVDHEGRVRRGMMRYTFVIVDLSANMSSTDLKPNRVQCAVANLRNFVSEFFEQNPISHLGLIVMKNRRADRLSELSGNAGRHKTALNEVLSQKEHAPSGEASLQNALELAHRSLKHMPSHASREVLIVMGSLTSCDPADIFETLQELKRDRIRVSIVGLAAAVKICQTICTTTNGTYDVMLDQEHLSELLQKHAVPPLCAPETEASLLRMGFPTHYTEGLATPCVCGHSAVADGGVRFVVGGFICPQCHSKHCDLPVECKTCGLLLVSTPHLARSFHHLFPVAPFTERPLATRASLGVLDSCFACCAQFGKDSGYQCDKCRRMFCFNCDVYIHDVLFNCPGCVH